MFFVFLWSLPLLTIPANPSETVLRIPRLKAETVDVTPTAKNEIKKKLQKNNKIHRKIIKKKVKQKQWNK